MPFSCAGRTWAISRATKLRKIGRTRELNSIVNNLQPEHFQLRSFHEEKPEIMNDDGDSSDHSARHSPEPSMRRSITQSTASPKVRKFLRRRRSQTFEDMAAQDRACGRYPT
eukprot:4078758-Amphidinium_carterae.1